jgi:hypothetical protein
MLSPPHVAALPPAPQPAQAREAAPGEAPKRANRGSRSEGAYVGLCRRR